MFSAAMSRSALLVLLLPLLVAVVAPVTSSPANLYLYPAAPGRGRAAPISARQANQILAHLLDVPGETLGASAGNRDAWDWLQTPSTGKQAVQNLFDDSTQKNVVLFTDLDEEDAKDVLPSEIRHTHTIASPPHASSFEALLHSYGERIYAALPVLGEQFGGFFTSAIEGAETALEGAADWLVASSSTGAWKKTLDEMNVGEEASAAFHQSMKNLVAFLDQRGQSDETDYRASYQTVRFTGLSEIKSTYGQESTEFQRAKQVLKAVLQAAVDKFDSLTATRPQKLALITLAQQESTLQPRSLDLLSPFRSSLSVTPFMKTRDEATLVSSKASKAPKESDFIGKCFTREEDLTKATLDCSGHGKAIQSSKGGKKCYRCQCRQSKGKGGRTISWAGAACQKEDISKPFVLLLTTTVGLIFVILGSVLYLFYEGQQELPSVLAGISIPRK